MSSDTTQAMPSRFLLNARRRQLFHALLNEEGIAPLAERQRPTAGDAEELPLSFAQERLWFLDRFQPRMFAYNIPGNFRVYAPMNVPALTRLRGSWIGLRMKPPIGYGSGVSASRPHDLPATR